MERTEFELFYSENFAFVRNFILKNGFPWAQAEEVAQEVFLRAWMHWNKRQHPDKSKIWVIKIALNACRSIKRTKKASILLVPITHSLEVNHTEEEYNYEIDSERILQKIDLLDHKNRKMVELYLLGCSHEEIGKTLGITTSNSRLRIHRVAEKMRS